MQQHPHAPTMYLDDLEILANNRSISLRNYFTEGFNKGLPEDRFKYELILPFDDDIEGLGEWIHSPDDDLTPVTEDAITLKASSCKPIPAISVLNTLEHSIILLAGLMDANQDVVNMEGQFMLMRSFTILSNYGNVHESGI
nr:1341_t:CDS:2 [Entrophospora candida]